nr:response regulator [Lachnospiraceae bacterium]
KEMSGKVLRIEVSSKTIYAGRMLECYYADRAEIWEYMVQTRISSVILSVVCLVVGVIIIAVFGIMRVITGRAYSIVYLGWMAVCSGFSILTESRFRQVIFPNATLAANLGYIILYGIGIAILLYFNEIQNYRYNIFHNTVGITMGVAAGLGVLSQALGIVSLDSAGPFSYLLSYIAFIDILITCFVDLKKNYITAYRPSVYGFFAFFVIALVEIFADTVGRNQNTGIFLSIGVLVFVIIAMYNTSLVFIHSEQEKNRVKALSDAKSSFLANMSHEIRTPINAVLGINEMISRESTEDKIIEYSDIIDRSGRLLLGIVNDILDFSKLEEGKMDIIPAKYRLADVLHNIDDTLRVKAVAKDLNFKMIVDPNLPEELFGDEVRIRQIIMNLVNNAIKYTDSGTVTTMVDGYAESEDTVRLIIAVSDTGRGIKEEDMDRLFKSFTRLEDKSGDRIEGTGLGLLIAKSLTERMGGSIDVRSLYGSGSTFTVRIPQKVLSSKKIGAFTVDGDRKIERKVYTPKFTAGNARLLIVDDDFTNRLVVTSFLKGTGIMLDEAGSGEEALEILKKKNFDIVVTDSMMAGMSGSELLKKARELPGCQTTKFIVITANALKGVREMFLDEGFDDYISKPVSADILETTVLRWIPPEKVESRTREAEAALIAFNQEPDDWGDDDLVHVGKTVLEGEKHRFAKGKDNISTRYIDLAILMENIKDSEIRRLTLSSITENAPKVTGEVLSLSEKLKEEPDDETFGTYMVKTHSMKGNANLVGAVALGEEAKALEYAGRDKDLEKILKDTEEFIKKWREMCTEIENIIKNKP